MKRNEISNYHGQNQGRCHLAAAIQLAVQRDKLEVEVLEEPVKVCLVFWRKGCQDKSVCN